MPLSGIENQDFFKDASCELEQDPFVNSREAAFQERFFASMGSYKPETEAGIEWFASAARGQLVLAKENRVLRRNNQRLTEQLSQMELHFESETQRSLDDTVMLDFCCYIQRKLVASREQYRNLLQVCHALRKSYTLSVEQFETLLKGGGETAAHSSIDSSKAVLFRTCNLLEQFERDLERDARPFRSARVSAVLAKFVARATRGSSAS